MQRDETGANGGWREIIRTERRRVGLTQAELGALVGVGALDVPGRVARPGFADIRFHGMVSPASEPDGTGFNDWIPVDAASHATLEGLLASRRVGRPEA